MDMEMDSTIKLRSADGMTLRVNKDFIRHSGMLTPLYEFDTEEDFVPLLRVPAEELKLVIEWFEKDDEARSELLQSWKDNLPLLLKLSRASSFLMIEELSIELAKILSVKVKRMYDVKEVNDVFHIPYDLTKEELETVQMENEEFRFRILESSDISGTV